MRKGKMLLRAAIIATVLATAATAAATEPLIDFDSGTSLVGNQKAHRIGDLVTIIISEQSSANAFNKSEANNKSEIGGGPGLGVFDIFGTWRLDVENRFRGQGETTRTGDLRAEISVRIVEVLPNDDYRIAGTRMVNINGEKQLIEITGICRARDIRSDNSILSTYISDAQIAYSGSGPMHASAEPGIITKIVNWLF